jgi:hypothetical protein
MPIQLFQPATILARPNSVCQTMLKDIAMMNSTFKFKKTLGKFTMF